MVIIKIYGEKSCSLFSLFENSLSAVQPSSLIKSHSKGSNGVLNSTSKHTQKQVINLKI